MGLFSRLAGTVALFFQVGGPSGPGWADNTALEARAAGGVLVNVRGADAIAATDFVTLQQLAGIVAALPSRWTAVAAGGTGAAAAGVAVAFAFTTTGGRCNASLPAAPTDGQVAVLKAVGATNTNGIATTPGTGQSVEDPTNPGTILAANAVSVFFGAGQVVIYRYQLLTTTWLID